MAPGGRLTFAFCSPQKGMKMNAGFCVIEGVSFNAEEFSKRWRVDKPRGFNSLAAGIIFARGNGQWQFLKGGTGVRAGSYRMERRLQP